MRVARVRRGLAGRASPVVDNHAKLFLTAGLRGGRFLNLGPPLRSEISLSVRLSAHSPADPSADMAAPAATSMRIGDLLIREGLITKEQLDKALQEQKQNGTRVGYNLVKLGFVP